VAVTGVPARAVVWALVPDPEEGASPPIYELECTTCLDTSAADEDAEVTRGWALDHADRNGHLGFRGVHTSFWRVLPAVENGARLIEQRDAAPVIADPP
jgi:hypothetical protein